MYVQVKAVVFSTDGVAEEHVARRTLGPFLGCISGVGPRGGGNWGLNMLVLFRNFKIKIVAFVIIDYSGR